MWATKTSKSWIYSSILALAATSAIGCGAAPDLDPANTASARVDSHRIISGPISDKLDEFENLAESLRFEECDTRSADRRKELAEALDGRSAEIQAFARSVPPAQEFVRVKVGPGTVLEAKEPRHPTRAWSERIKSWDVIYSDYLKIKGLPVGAEWAALDKSVRSILMDDESRFEGANLYLDKDSGPLLEGIGDALSKCLALPGCRYPELTPSQQSFLLRNPLYARYLKDPRGHDIKKLSSRIAGDYKRYEFRREKTLTRLRSGVLQIPLVAGVFEEVTQQLAGYIEAVWNSPGLQLKIKWVKAKSVPAAFRILLEPIIGERAYVDYQKRAMQLFLDSRAASLAHETGHILGFGDHYYTVWHPESCSYVIQSNQLDVMSDSSRGSVTAEEWATLDQRYPL